MTNIANNATTNTSLIDADHPWPGLLPFTEDAKAFFHGRETETTELTRLIEREPLTVLFGQSGLGKSSLLNAGVFPRLRRAGYLPLYLRLNLDANAPALIDQVWQILKDECARHEVSATKQREGDSFWKYLHRPGTLLQNPHGRPVTAVLAFDQFEELFTLGRQTPQQIVRCQTFLRELGELIENRLPPSLEDELTEHPEALDDFDLLKQNLKIVFAFREDYLAEFEGLKTLIRPIMQNRMRLTPMMGSRAAQAIKLAGQERVSETVAARIVRFVGGAGKDESTPLEQVQVEPALLSLMCRELNEQRLQRGEAEISADLIQGDNTKQIIEQFYRTGFEGIGILIRHFVEDRLLTAAGYRDSCALDNALAEPGITEVALQTLVDRRILRREERGGLVRLELIHDVLAGVAKASRDQRRAEAEHAAYTRILAGQQRQRRWLGAGAVILVLFQGLLGWMVWDIFQLKAEAKHNLALGLAEKAERAFSEQRFNEGQMLSSHALAGLDPTREFALMASLSAQRIANPTNDAITLNANSGAVSADGKTFASANLDNSLTLREVDTGKELRTLHGHASLVIAIAFSPDGRIVVSGSKDKTIRLWDVASGKCIHTLGGHNEAVSGVAFSPDGRTLASGSRDATLRIWEVTSGKPVTVATGYGSAAVGIAFSPDGLTVAAGSWDNTVRVWDVASGKAIANLSGHRKAVRSVAFSPDGRTLASVSQDNMVRLWKLATGARIAEMSGHANSVNSVAFSPDGLTLASGSDDKTVRLWDLTTKKALRILGGHSKPVDSVAFIADGKKLASAAMGTMTFWNLARATEPLTLRGHEGRVVSVAFSVDGKLLATGSLDNTVRVWDFGTGKLVATLTGHTRAITTVAFSPDGRILASGSRDHTVRLWEVPGGKLISALGGHADQVASVAFSLDGRTLASGSMDKTVRLWDVSSGKSTATLTGHGGAVYGVAFSPIGRLLASGSADKSLRLWDVDSGKEIFASGASSRIEADQPVFSIAFSPDGSKLAAGQLLTRNQVWNLQGAKILQRMGLSTQNKMSSGITFSPDGQNIAAVTETKTLSEDERKELTLQLWNVTSGKALGAPIDLGSVAAIVNDVENLAGQSFARIRSSAPIETTGAVSFSPDGKWLALPYSGNALRIWPVGPLSSTAIDWEVAAVADEKRYGLKVEGLKLVPQ